MQLGSLADMIMTVRNLKLAFWFYRGHDKDSSEFEASSPVNQFRDHARVSSSTTRVLQKARFSVLVEHWLNMQNSRGTGSRGSNAITSFAGYKGLVKLLSSHGTRVLMKLHETQCKGFRHSMSSSYGKTRKRHVVIIRFRV